MHNFSFTFQETLNYFEETFQEKNDFSATKVCSKVIDAVSHFANVVIIENQVTKIYRLNETLGPQQRLVKQKVTSEKVR